MSSSLQLVAMDTIVVRGSSDRGLMNTAHYLGVVCGLLDYYRPCSWCLCQSATPGEGNSAVESSSFVHYQLTVFHSGELQQLRSLEMSFFLSHDTFLQTRC